MKKLLLLAAGLLFLGHSANAITPNELATANSKGYAIEVVNTPAFQFRSSTTGKMLATNFPYTSSGDVTIVNGTYLNIVGFFNGNFTINGTVSGTTFSMQGSGTRKGFLQYCRDTRPVSGIPSDYTSTKVYEVYGIRWTGGTNYTTTNSTLTASIDDTTYPNYYILTFNSPLEVDIYTTYSDYQRSKNAEKSTRYHQYQLWIPRFEYNTTFHDNYMNTDREFEGHIYPFWDQNLLKILNFQCRGFAIENYTPDGEPNAIGGSIDYTKIKLHPETHQIELPMQKLRSGVPQSSGVVQQITMYSTCPSNATTLNNEPSVWGTYEISPINHEGTSRWHKDCKGELVTKVQFDAKLNDYKLRNEYYDDEVGPYKNTTFSAELEYTANPTFETLTFGVDPSKNRFFKVWAKINEFNGDLVDHYEAVIVPGQHTGITTSNDFHHQYHGHNKAFNITLNGNGIFSSNDSKQLTIEHSFTEKQLQDAGWTQAEIEDAFNHKASFYVKSVYAEPKARAAAMESSFSGLQTQAIPTGINDVEVANVNALATAANGVINIHNYEGVTQVYTATGACVYSGTATEIPVSTGVYIVKFGSKAQKLSVR